MFLNTAKFMPVCIGLLASRLLMPVPRATARLSLMMLALPVPKFVPMPIGLELFLSPNRFCHCTPNWPALETSTLTIIDST